MAVVQSYFTPMTFDEMVKPLQMYKEEFQRQEDLYNTLGEDASQWGQLLDPVLDNEAYEQWSDFNQAYTEGVDSLMTNGLTGSRNKLMKARFKFGQKVKPIIEANTKRDDYIKTRQAIQQQNPDIFFKKEDVRIGDFMNGKTPDNTAIDRGKMMEDAANYATAIGKAMSKIQSTPVGGYYMDIMTREGLTPEVFQALNDDTFTRQFVDKAVEGIDEKKNPQKYAAAKKYAEAQAKEVTNAAEELRSYLQNVDTRLKGFDRPENAQYIRKSVEDAMRQGIGAWQHNIQRDLGKVDASTLYQGANQLKIAKMNDDTQRMSIIVNKQTADANRKEGARQADQQNATQLKQLEYEQAKDLYNKGAGKYEELKDKKGNVVTNHGYPVLDYNKPKSGLSGGGAGRTFTRVGTRLYTDQGTMVKQQRAGTGNFDVAGWVNGSISDYGKVIFDGSEYKYYDAKNDFNLTPLPNVPEDIKEQVNEGYNVSYNPYRKRYLSEEIQPNSYPNSLDATGVIGGGIDMNALNYYMTGGQQPVNNNNK